MRIKLYELLSKGVWGHAPQEIFGNLGPLKLYCTIIS